MSGSTEQQQQTTQSNDPWAGQQPYLTAGFSAASRALDRASTAPDPTGFLAQMTPEQLGTFRSMLGFAGNSTVPGQQTAAGSALTNAGLGGVTGALTGFSNFNPSNTLDSSISGANQYVQGLDIPGQVNAAMRDAKQTARDVQLPGIEANAAVTGNTNSSRTALRQGLVDRGLAQQAADISAGLRNNAFNTGAALTSDINRSADASNLAALQARGGLGSESAGRGLGALSSGIDAQTALFNLANMGGAGLQQANQLGYDEQMARRNYAVNSPFDALNNYWRIVGGNSWGSESQGTQNTTQTPSAWTVAGGLMGTAGSFLGSGGTGGGSGLLGAARLFM